MDKLKIGIGLGVMIIFGVLLAHEIGIGIVGEISYYQCTHPPAGYLGSPYPCQNLLSHLKFILIYSVPVGVGILFLISGLLEFSLGSFSRKTTK